MSLLNSDVPCNRAACGESHFEHAGDALPHILWTARPDGCIDYLSKAYFCFTGLKPGASLQNWLDSLHPDDRPGCIAAWAEAVEKGQDYSIEFRAFHHATAQYRWQAVNAKPKRNAAGQIEKWYGICVDIHDSRLAKNEAHNLSRRLQATLEHMSDAFFMLDSQWRFAYLNSAAERVLGCRGEEILGRYLEDEYPEALFPSFYAHYRRALNENCAVHFESYDAHLNKWFEFHAYPSDQGLSVYFRDVSARKQAVLELERTSRGLRMLSRTSAALLRIDSEEALLQEICHVALEGKDYRAAWTAIAEDDPACSIRVAAWAGDAAVGDYIAGLTLSWSDATPLGQGPTGRAIRTGEPVVFTDALCDPSFEPWRDAAAKSHYLSGVCLPLRNRERTFGVLVLVNHGKRAISADEIGLLQELADNLSFGITHIREQKKKRQVENAMLKVAASISTSSGTEFFHTLVTSMAEAIGADSVFLSRLLPGSPPVAARVIAGTVDGNMVEGIHYELAGTPCALLMTEGACIIEDDLLERFPALAAYMPPEAQACAGYRLDDAAGRPLGTLFMVTRKRIDHPELVSSILRIFAARAAAELERQEKEAHIHYQASLLDKARDAIVVRDMEGRIVFWNEGAEHLYGWKSAEVMGRREDDFLYDAPSELGHILEQVLRQEKWSGEQVTRHRNGSSVIVDGSWTLVRNDQGKPQSIFSIHTDISDRKAAENEIQRLAFYDQLTGLPNRQLLRDRLQQAVRASARTRHCGALMFLDLDNFKELNDIYGHDRGDLLLKHVAQRLGECVRSSDTVARLGGDEFVVVVEELAGEVEQAASQAEHIAEKVRATLNRTYDLNGCQHISTPSIGVVLFDGSATQIDELLKCADLAMYKAKAAGRNAIRFYDPDMQAAVIAKVALEADLRESIEKDLFTLVYQPQVDSAYRLIGVEALVRWQHPARRDVPPSVFIPLAEETWLILGLGRRVLERACRQLAQWAQDPATAGLTLAVNISARQFHHPEFVSEVLDIVHECGANPAKLKLELTESMLVEDTAEAAAKMAELQWHGVGFSLDDFGTGYSSLSYLRRLPLEQLKIDHSFIAEVPGNENDVSIVEAIIALGRKLGLHVIAEGVETQQQRDFLCNIGCQAYQGYLFSRPLSAEDFAAYLQQHVRHRQA